MNKLSILILCIIVSIAVSAASIWYYDNNCAVQITAFDLRAYIDDLKKDYADKKISKAELNAKIDNLGTVLEQVSDRKIIFLKEVIIHGNIETIEMPN